MNNEWNVNFLRNTKCLQCVPKMKLYLPKQKWTRREKVIFFKIWSVLKIKTRQKRTTRETLILLKILPFMYEHGYSHKILLVEAPFKLLFTYDMLLYCHTSLINIYVFRCNHLDEFSDLKTRKSYMDLEVLMSIEWLHSHNPMCCQKLLIKIYRGYLQNLFKLSTNRLDQFFEFFTFAKFNFHSSSNKLIDYCRHFSLFNWMSWRERIIF